MRISETVSLGPCRRLVAHFLNLSFRFFFFFFFSFLFFSFLFSFFFFLFSFFLFSFSFSFFFIPVFSLLFSNKFLSKEKMIGQQRINFGRKSLQKKWFFFLIQTKIK